MSSYLCTKSRSNERLFYRVHNQKVPELSLALHAIQAKCPGKSGVGGVHALRLLCKSLNPQQLFPVCLLTAPKKKGIWDLSSASNLMHTGRRKSEKINVCPNAPASSSKTVGGWEKIGEPSRCLSLRYQEYGKCRLSPWCTPQLPPPRHSSSTTTTKMMTQTVQVICRTLRGFQFCPPHALPVPLPISTSGQRSSTLATFPQTFRDPMGQWVMKMRMRNPATVTQTFFLLPLTVGVWDSWQCFCIQRVVVPPGLSQ